MASNSRKKSNTGKKKTSSPRKNSKKNVSEFSMETEISLFLILAAGIILMLSNFGIGGSLSKPLSNFFFGLFGSMEYIFPIAVVVTAFLMASNLRDRIKMKVMISWIFFFAVGVEIHLLSGYTGDSAVSYYEYATEHKFSGGLLCGMLGDLLKNALGIVCTYVIVSLIAVVCLIFLSGRSFVKEVHKGSEKVYHSAKEDAKRRKEQAETRKKMRMDNKVSGVSSMTKLEKSKPETDNIHEITVKFPHQEKKTECPEEEIIIEPVIQEYEQAVHVIPEPDLESEEEVLLQTVMKESAETKKETAMAVETETKKIEAAAKKAALDTTGTYKKPPLSLLSGGNGKKSGNSESELKNTAMKLQQTLENFGVKVTITNVSCGPSVTRYELQPQMGVKVSKIVNLADDIKLYLAAKDIRIEAPIPGKSAVGIEVPNRERSTVMLRDLLESKEFQKHPSKIAFAVGKDIGGETIVADIAKMPHLLIAGATGSGKSVFVNSLIMSILYKATPDEVKLIMIDPKMVEFQVYNGIPHLFIPVVTDPKKAAGALNWAVMEMTERYQKFAETGVRDLRGYNEKVEALDDIEDEEKPQKLPQIVIIVDELADLMMVSPGEVEDSIVRLTQLARAAGIHLIIATQRPSVNVVTGLIKANMPSRVALSLASGVDSRTVIDMNGAEKLLGNGDMLFGPTWLNKPIRVQGAWVSDEDRDKVVAFLKEQNVQTTYNEKIEEKMNEVHSAAAVGGADERDELFIEAGRFVIEKDKGSIGMLQRMFKIGFNRAARIMDQLADAGVVGEEEGTKPRRVLMSLEEFEQYIEDYV